jgi:uncharacterized protein (DUF2141 family)
MKNFSGKFIIPFLILFFTAQCFTSTAQNVELTIKGIRSTKGQLLIGIFKDNESFQKEKSYKNLKIEKTDVINGTLTVKFSFEAGIFGFTLLDDENSNGKMDYNFIGFPLEGFGFSNYYHRGFTKPDFSSFSLTLTKTLDQKIVIEIRYM